MKKTFLKNKKNVQFLIIGLGLIGGSIAKRLSKNGFEVLALDSSKSTLHHAKNTTAIKGSVHKCDFTKKLFVIVALPPKTILRGFDTYLDLFQKADFITDCTSVKESLLSQIKKNNLQKKFLLSHPIAGAEKSGFLNSNENLFEDKVSIVLKHKGISKNALQISQELWSELGSKTFNLDSKFHDRIFSLTSHIPHIVAFSLISLLSKRKDFDNIHYLLTNALRKAQRFAEHRITNKGQIEEKTYLNKSIDRATREGDLDEILRLQQQSRRL